jgi:hypothetical protein
VASVQNADGVFLAKGKFLPLPALDIADVRAVFGRLLLRRDQALLADLYGALGICYCPDHASLKLLQPR